MPHASASARRPCEKVWTWAPRWPLGGGTSRCPTRASARRHPAVTGLARRDRCSAWFPSPSRPGRVARTHADPKRGAAAQPIQDHCIGAIGDREALRARLAADIALGVEDADQALLVDPPAARAELGVHGAEEDLDLAAAVDLDEGRPGVERAKDSPDVVLDDGAPMTAGPMSAQQQDRDGHVWRAKFGRGGAWALASSDPGRRPVVGTFIGSKAGDATAGTSCYGPSARAAIVACPFGEPGEHAVGVIGPGGIVAKTIVCTSTALRHPSHACPRQRHVVAEDAAGEGDLPADDLQVVAHEQEPMALRVQADTCPACGRAYGRPAGRPGSAAPARPRSASPRPGAG